MEKKRCEWLVDGECLHPKNSSRRCSEDCDGEIVLKCASAK